MVFADAPYNVPASMISGMGKHEHPRLRDGCGEMSQAEFTQFLSNGI